MLNIVMNGFNFFACVGFLSQTNLLFDNSSGSVCSVTLGITIGCVTFAKLFLHCIQIWRIYSTFKGIVNIIFHVCFLFSFFSGYVLLLFFCYLTLVFVSRDTKHNTLQKKKKKKKKNIFFFFLFFI